MSRKLVIDRIKTETEVHQNVCRRKPMATLQYVLDVLYGEMRHTPDFGLQFLDGLRQAQKDLDHLVNLAAGNPPETTKKSSLLRQLAASTEFNSVSKELIAKAERLERQAEGLRYKFSKERIEKK